ncbi:hypothetical protein Rhow_008076 [Rhodococcus wratislaviensis]|uniref:Uncharacterized protein n=1 Tax=Rhodococcus wratislaviensis TaxID=44752 RepID=A0A402CJN6_RHOWR|nr:hypothetical protein Rhow_008076 [Rhodococcus wratislaviensis]
MRRCPGRRWPGRRTRCDHGIWRGTDGPGSPHPEPVAWRCTVAGSSSPGPRWRWS